MTTLTPGDLWDRYQQYLCSNKSLGLSVDVSRMHFDGAYLQHMEPAIQGAFQAMDQLEKGAIANPDEQRMVGHYWLRAPQLAPTPELAAEIDAARNAIVSFAAEIHAAGKFTQVLSIGIGGSALGPMFVADALGDASDRMRVQFIDNSDPDGICFFYQWHRCRWP